MQFFADYVQPLNQWLSAHPEWSAIITFLISFAESLAIVGAIIPGTLTMTILGILAGTGVIRIDHTLIAATLGAVAGDWGSYLLGYHYSDRITAIWPFRKYPNWLVYGKIFFNKHGGKSVLLARFIGPFRSIIPVIAGMLHMPMKNFFIANFISAIGWSLLFIMPGYMIGAASAELSREAATKLILLVLLLIALIWIASILIKWLIIHLNRVLSIQFHRLWIWADQKSVLKVLIRKITPEKERRHATTALILFGALLSFAGYFWLTLSVLLNKGLVAINTPVYLFLQSIRTSFFDHLLVLFSALQKPFTLLVFGLFIQVLLIVRKDWRSLAFWYGLHLTCLSLILLSNVSIHSLYPHDPGEGNAFPSSGLTFLTAQLYALLFYFKQDKLQKIASLLFTILLLLTGFSQIYLGDQWILDIVGGLFAGLCLCLFFGLFYRKKTNSSYPANHWILILPLFLFLSSVYPAWKYLQKPLNKQQPAQSHRIYSKNEWWHQTTALLPVYRHNRVGKAVELFNIQYLGNLQVLEKALIQAGWQKQENSLLNSVIHRVTGSSRAESPLMAELYLLKKPVLVMTLKNDKAADLILKFWQSSDFIESQPVWLGSVRYKVDSKQKNFQNTSPLTALSPMLKPFKRRILTLPIDPATAISLKISPNLLLVSEF